MTAIPSPLRPLLGSSLADLDESRLQHLLGIEENQHLEFKRDLESSREARIEQIRDLVSFANAGGGLVLFGVDEDSETRTASALCGLETDVDVVRQLEQIIVERSHPVIPATVDRIPLASGRQVVAVVIAPSPLAPHAVIEKKRMSWPVRRGHGKDYLTEAQLADSYARRFAGAAAITEQLTDLHHDHEKLLALEHLGWVVVSLVPTAPAPGVISPDAENEGRDWIERFERRRLDGDGRGARAHWNVRIGYRGLELIDQGEGTHQHGHLLVDGGGTAAAAILISQPRYEEPSLRGMPIGGRTPSAIAETIVDHLDLLASHAVDVGAGGDAHLAVSVHLDDNAILQIKPAHDGHGRIGPEFGRRQGPCPISLRSVELTPLVDNPAAFLQAAHLLATDITSRYGTSDLEVLDAAGVITEGASAEHERLSKWARQRGGAESPATAPDPTE